jgi:uridine kinase
MLMKRAEMIEQLAEFIQQINRPHPLRVAIDGVDASGKTTLANELATALQRTDRKVIRASVDNFHNPEHIRRRQGSLSPEGFYYDSYNYPALVKNLLEPLGPNGDRRYKASVFNLRQDMPVVSPLITATKDAILLLDGIFLLRPQLLAYWDLTIYIGVEFCKTLERGATRDAELYGSYENAELRYRERYIPGQQLYHQEAQPLDKADILIDNNDLEQPKFLRTTKASNKQQ